MEEEIEDLKETIVEIQEQIDELESNNEDLQEEVDELELDIRNYVHQIEELEINTKCGSIIDAFKYKELERIFEKYELDELRKL